MRSTRRRYVRALNEANRALEARGRPENLDPTIAACLLIFVILWIIGIIIY